ncbi:hypothetical protein ACFQPA_14090 [Halomarina halobia]|uniref:DUF7967 domain-containing protein n=2 Tax=Halomarina halobia TaxID=3033386 RepID=A0ABD6A9U8_9EURY
MTRSRRTPTADGEAATIATRGRPTGYKSPPDEGRAMPDDDADGGTVRLWLVERTYDDRNLITLVYATPDGERYRKRERSANLLGGSGGVTAAIEADPDDLAAVEDDETRERYAREAARMADRHAPDDTI